MNSVILVGNITNDADCRQEVTRTRRARPYTRRTSSRIAWSSCRQSRGNRAK